MLCQRVPDDSYRVVVKFPKSFRRRCEESWNSCKSWCRESWNYCKSSCFCFLITFFYLSFAFIVFGLVWVLVFCHDSPGMSLEAVSIRDMAVYQNYSIPAPESPWQVDSGFGVRLSTWNPNTVAGCSSTFRRIIVRVEYRGQIILQQEIPLGFGLKPRRSRPVSMELKGDGFQLKNPDLGPFMENELRSDNVTLEFFFGTRYLRNDRKGGWLNMGCHVVAKSPSNSYQVGANSLLKQDCVGY